MDNISNATAEMKASSSAYMEALTRSGQIWASGFQELAKMMASMAQSQIQANADMCKSLGAVKSVPEAVELHTAHVHTCCSKAVDDLATLTAATLKLAEKTMAQAQQQQPQSMMSR